MEYAPWYTWAFEGVGVLLLSTVGAVIWRWIKGRKSEEAEGRGITIQTGALSYGSPIAYGSQIVQNVSIGAFPAPRNPSSEYRDTPTPEEIERHLHSLPIFQQLRVKDSYIGLKVRWTTYLANIRPSTATPDQYVIWLRRKRGQPNPTVTFYVKLTDFPVVGSFEKSEKRRDMKVFWWQNGLHFEPETREERKALALLLCSTRHEPFASSEESTISTCILREHVTKIDGANS